MLRSTQQTNRGWTLKSPEFQCVTLSVSSGTSCMFFPLLLFLVYFFFTFHSLCMHWYTQICIKHDFLLSSCYLWMFMLNASPGHNKCCPNIELTLKGHLQDHSGVKKRCKNCDFFSTWYSRRCDVMRAMVWSLQWVHWVHWAHWVTQPQKFMSSAMSCLACCMLVTWLLLYPLLSVLVWGRKKKTRLPAGREEKRTEGKEQLQLTFASAVVWVRVRVDRVKSFPLLEWSL